MGQDIYIKVVLVRNIDSEYENSNGLITPVDSKEDNLPNLQRSQYGEAKEFDSNAPTYYGCWNEICDSY